MADAVAGGDHVSAVDDAGAQARLLLQVLVEVHAGVVLVELRRHLVLGVLDRDALRVVDAFAGRVVFPEEAAAGGHRVEV